MSYITVKDQARCVFTEKKSEFIGSIAPVKTNDQAVDFINEIRSMHRKASHNVYAYILREDNITRYSDDGEPQGTAGVPVLEVLKRESLVDVVCVVTRYFGGVLLGAGGLVRAYSHTAKLALKAAKKLNMCSCYELELNMDYILYGRVQYMLNDFPIKLLNSDFTDVVRLDVLIKSDFYENFKKELTEISGGRIKINTSEIKEADFELD